MIDDPIQITPFTPHAVNDTKHEGAKREGAKRKGGTLEVAAAVHATQRAYESQLSAVVVSNLNRDGSLPTTVPTRALPVVAQLARLVAFETLEQQKGTPADDFADLADQMPEGLQQQTTLVVPPMLEAVSAQRSASRFHHATAPVVVVEESATLAIENSTRNAYATANLAERVDDEQQATYATTYAQWPALAAVIAGYLMFDRNVASTAIEQRVPNRKRN